MSRLSFFAGHFVCFQTLILGLALCLTQPVSAQSNEEHDHHRHGDSHPVPVERPKVFLDKSPRVVQYQLSRLDNQRLLLVERDTSDPKYAPVYEAILGRPGMTNENREEALSGLVAIRGTNPVTELVKGIENIQTGDKDGLRTLQTLGGMLISLPKQTLRSHIEELRVANHQHNNKAQIFAVAARIMAEDLTPADLQSSQTTPDRLAFLKGLELVPKAGLRDLFVGPTVSLFEASSDPELTNQSIRVLGSVTQIPANTYSQLVENLDKAKFRDELVTALLRLPAPQKNSPEARLGVQTLVGIAERTPTELRTAPAFLDAMQLAEKLLATISAEDARVFRSRLREITVRVIQIRTVEEEMRYDLPYFVVEAGKAVQVVLRNVDIMPHNLVITSPGALQEIAELGLQVGPDKGWEGKPYVPQNEKVLFATSMVEADKQELLTFVAPNAPGEYPYVCTFPQHWMRMHGVMVVVEDLDAWLENPVEPASPIGNNRSFVQAWSVEALQDELEQGLRGRNLEIGRQIFVEATCRQCHQAETEGGRVGPSLNGLSDRWKGDHRAILQEVLEPSHRIDPKYAMHLVLTADGRTISGLITEENKDHIKLLSSPESTEPAIIQQDDIEEIVKTSTSLMPKGLLDQFTKDELFELLAYLNSLK